MAFSFLPRLSSRLPCGAQAAAQLFPESLALLSGHLPRRALSTPPRPTCSVWRPSRPCSIYVGVRILPLEISSARVHTGAHELLGDRVHPDWLLPQRDLAPAPQARRCASPSGSHGSSPVWAACRHIVSECT